MGLVSAVLFGLDMPLFIITRSEASSGNKWKHVENMDLDHWQCGHYFLRMPKRKPTETYPAEKSLTVLYYRSDHEMIDAIKKRLNIRSTAEAMRVALKEAHATICAG